MLNIKKIITALLHKYVYEDWNIGIADISFDLTPVNIKWMKHDYKDRWFADPFIVEETADSYIVLAEECPHGSRGRLVRLTISKNDCRLINREVILDLPTHLSFPNIIEIETDRYLYPENAAAGDTKYYKYGTTLTEIGVLSEVGFADPVIVKYKDHYYLMATVGADCNGNKLKIYRSDTPLTGYTEIQEIGFDDNIARRAGNIFEYKGKLISPAQVCNDGYGRGVSFQELTFHEDNIQLKEIKRVYPPSKQYPEGFHTYNVYCNTVIIDGYRFGSKLLHNLYFKFRKPRNK